MSVFGHDYKGRKRVPIFDGVLGYFPAALAELAKVSFEGNRQHNPGEPLHWARGKSSDNMNTALRHMVDHFYDAPQDEDGAYHLAKAAWRILAELQLHLEERNLVPMAFRAWPVIQPDGVQNDDDSGKPQDDGGRQPDNRGRAGRTLC